MTGFGFGLVAMPLLPLVMNFQDAVALAVLLNMVVTGITFFTMKAHYSWHHGSGLVVGACVGVPIGVYVLIHANELLLRHLLGATMCLFAANELLLSKKYVFSERVSFPCGLASGALGGAFNMGGPPAVAFVYSQPWSKEQTVAILQVAFGLSALLRLALFGCTGLLDKRLLSFGAWALLPLALAIFAGISLSPTIPHERLKRAVFLFLGAMGIKYLLTG